MVITSQPYSSKLYVDIIEKYRVTVLTTGTTAYNMFLDHIEKFGAHNKVKSLNYVILGGSAVTHKLVQKSKEILPNVQILSIYGMTETAKVVAMTSNFDGALNCVGTLTPNTQVKVRKS